MARTDADTAADLVADLVTGVLTAARRCGALALTMLLSLRGWWRRRPSGTRTVIGTSAMILASSLVSLLLGLSTATASAPVGPHEATWSTTLDSTITLDLGPLGTASMESPAGVFGVKVVLGEIPGDPAPNAANAASVGQSLSSDAASYLSLVSHPDLTIRQGLYGLAGDAMRRAGVIEAIFLCCVAAWRLAPTRPWRETIRAGASHRWATTVAVSATVAAVTSLLVPVMRTNAEHGSTLSVLEGTPWLRPVSLGASPTSSPPTAPRHAPSSRPTTTSTPRPIPTCAPHGRPPSTPRGWWTSQPPPARWTPRTFRPGSEPPPRRPWRRPAPHRRRRRHPNLLRARHPLRRRRPLWPRRPRRRR